MTAYIQFNGQRSDDFGLRIYNNVSHESTGFDVETVVVPGRDGELLLSNRRLKAVEKTFPFRLLSDVRVTEVQEKISNWLNVEGYKPLLLSWDSAFEYKAAFIKTFEVEEVLRNFGKLQVTFLVHPIKYYVDGLIERPLKNGENLRGRGNELAHPIIKLKGNGDCVLKINDRETHLKNIEGGIILDMQSNTVYQGKQGAWDKFIRSPQSVKPYLDIDANKITWTGDFSATIMPFWGSKV
ncbi:phage tail protein [Atopobacter sp. AH10]|uniref:phage tail family protein n=1 Tax=Atopobacter sp. AH10 TaxID=2315861 RepID=UPI000EF23857|nr:phage tail family protein [Atopobacter sp. AH10]RLK63149.1 phage tail protein [Atopobacter sp. AH10]